jgi:predicted lipoprotein with Yx(FWY)xxD motif
LSSIQRIYILALVIALTGVAIVQSQTNVQGQYPGLSGSAAEEQQRLSMAVPDATYYAEKQRLSEAVEPNTTEVIGFAGAYNQSWREYSVNLATNASLGQYLVDQNGFTLYRFANDSQGVSTCYSQCAVNWPPFFAEDMPAGKGLNASDFTQVNRTDGIRQTAFRGWPLYYFFQDKNPGDFKGQGLQGAWFVVNPSNLTAK